MSFNNLRQAPEFQSLAELIKEKSARGKIFLVRSPGNWGDALINVGTDQFMRYFGIKYEALTRGDVENDLIHETERFEELRDGLILVGGGGGWCTNYSSTQTFVQRLADAVTQIVVLPTTYDLGEIASKKAAITYFSRDRYGSLKSIPSSRFCHDMAFFLRIDSIQSEEPAWRIFAMRADKERSNRARPLPTSIDVSLLGNSYHSVEPMFQILSRFNQIYTDRLHIAIAGSLMTKDVGLLPGNYSKSLDVWKSSIFKSYEKTRFIEWDDWSPSV